MVNFRWLRRLGIVLVGLLLPLVVWTAARAQTPSQLDATLIAQAGGSGINGPTNAYFGDLHVHTAWSADAFGFGTRTGPREAYEYAKGNAIPHPSGYDIQLSKPLDFYAVTDHSEYLGVFTGMLDPDNPLSQHPLALLINSDDEEDRTQAAMLASGTISGGDVIPEFADEETSRSYWQQIIEIADEYYEPGTFTTLPAFEWTSNGGASHFRQNSQLAS